MTWTIARQKAGYVVLEEKDIELSPFDVLCFLDVDAPAPGPAMDALREQLPGTRGHFQIEGQFPSAVNRAIEEGHSLTVRFDTRGYKLEAGIDIQGQLKTVVPPGKKDTDTSQQYDFTVKREVYVTADNAV